MHWQGVYPRVCGVTHTPPPRGKCRGGLSPRVRGHHASIAIDVESSGSIPACAGSPGEHVNDGLEWRVYPRVCGVTPRLRLVTSPLLGLSPRVRGHPPLRTGTETVFGSIPACAGSPQIHEDAAPSVQVYPRVCGVTSTTVYIINSCVGLSPRVRGHHWYNNVNGRVYRSIPACAGSPDYGKLLTE